MFTAGTKNVPAASFEMGSYIQHNMYSIPVSQRSYIYIPAGPADGDALLVVAFYAIGYI
jgi:hypothetical protein